MKWDKKHLMYYGGTLLTVTGVMMYVTASADVIPDAITFVGFLDDASLVIIGWLFFQRLRKNLRRKR
jgi:uncharacterized membrane protein YkvA (DUF1232 family)